MQFQDFIILNFQIKKEVVRSCGQLMAKYSQDKNSCDIYDMFGYYAAVYFSDNQYFSVTGHYFEVDVSIGYKLSLIASSLFKSPTSPQV